MSQSRFFLPPVARPDGIAFPLRIEIVSPVPAQDLLHLKRDGTRIHLAVSQVEMTLAIVRASVTLTPALARHVSRLLDALADEAERAGA